MLNRPLRPEFSLRVPAMAYDVEYTDEFESWWNGLTVREEEDVRPVVRLLEERGWER